MVLLSANQANQAVEQLRSRLRPGQQRIADWDGGPLAVSAVPGAGKSTGMAIAAAILLSQRYRQAKLQQSIPTGQLVLVTFTRSAVANLKTKVRQALRQLSLAPNGFVVHTLHGLALNIATRHPELSGLRLDRITLVSTNQSHRLIRLSVEQWLATNPPIYQRLLEGRSFDGEETERLRRQSVLRTEILPALAYTAVHEAKSSGLSPVDLRELSQTMPSDEYDVLAIAAGLYEQYEALLRSRQLIDYDDMILAALRVLDDAETRRLWQQQIFAVFEDEAQDSSPLQTRLLEILATDSTPAVPVLNLVRVGDPNQAINSTFTPADPIFFRQFCETCDREGRLAEMDQAGRSSEIIIDAANFMLTWVNSRYSRSPDDTLASPFRPQQIHPVAFNDPQPDANPDPIGQGLELCAPRDVYHTVELIGQRIAQLFAIEPQAKVAVLVRENRQGQFVSDRLRYPDRYGLDLDLSGIDIYDVGQQDRHSHIPSEMLALLQFLDRPHSSDATKAALQVMVDRQLIPTQDLNVLAAQPEQFLYPVPIDPPQPEPMQQARRFCTSLLRARLELPQYQLISFLALALKYKQSELATADKLSDRLAQQTAGNHSMSAVLAALGEIAASEQFAPVETDNVEERYTRSRQVTVITMHKAKGLDWDFVFLPFLHEHLIPGRPWIPQSAKFLGDFSLAEVARAQIRAQIHQDNTLPEIAAAWQRAGYLKIAEEFRLLYVAMTRAKRLLWMSAAQKAPTSWNAPDRLEDKAPCPVLTVLRQRYPQAIVP